ncbi:hypothetical protein, partial [Salmonella sp. ZJQZ20_0020]|uniref:hypothetical protein n=1 Tax=Salmonella sp. ZJQZ20_0020 TaxID=3159627 RepID=UPI00397F1395
MNLVIAVQSSTQMQTQNRAKPTEGSEIVEQEFAAITNTAVVNFHQNWAIFRNDKFAVANSKTNAKRVQLSQASFSVSN